MYEEATFDPKISWREREMEFQWKVVLVQKFKEGDAD